MLTDVAKRTAASGTRERRTKRVEIAVVADGEIGDVHWQAKERADFVIAVSGGVRQAAKLLEVAPSQPSRWASGKSTPGPVQARMLVDLDHVMAHALLVWSSESVVRDWLSTPNAHLDGHTPAAWIRQHGTNEVVDALRAEASGSYA